MKEDSRLIRTRSWDRLRLFALEVFLDRLDGLSGNDCATIAFTGLLLRTNKRPFPVRIAFCATIRTAFAVNTVSYPFAASKFLKPFASTCEGK